MLCRQKVCRLKGTWNITLPDLLDRLDDGEGLAGAGRAEDDVRDTRKTTLENTRHLE
jgi:hypothetical protein